MVALESAMTSLSVAFSIKGLVQPQLLRDHLGSESHWVHPSVLGSRVNRKWVLEQKLVGTGTADSNVNLLSPSSS